MRKLSSKSTSHRLLFNFVDWIRPEESTEETIRVQADEIRSRIKGKATNNGLTVRSTPWSGSFAKKTGLRRHRRGNHDIEGQDIDLAFVVSPQTKEGEDIKSLLDKFETYAKESYPYTPRTRTKSSVCLEFKGTKLIYDLVPMLAVPNDDEAQVLLQNDGGRRKTSVQKHIEFIKRRNQASNLIAGRVKFNECVRLVKWWREMRQSDSSALPEVPTVIINLLCAHAFDQCKVFETYTETLAHWFGHIAHVVKKRQTVRFTDFGDRTSQATGLWLVLDPVNPDNNVVSWLTNLQIDELGSWFADARDAMSRVIAADVADEDGKVRDELVVLFGNAIKDHGVAL